MSLATPTFIDEDLGLLQGYNLAGDYFLPAILVNLLRNHFAADPKTRIPALRDLVYRDQNSVHVRPGAATDLRISLFDDWNPAVAGTYPAIIAKDGECASTRLGMNDQHMGSGGTNLNAVKYYSRAWAGSCVLFCVSRKPAQARLLARESMAALEVPLVELKRKCGFYVLTIASIGAVKPILELPDLFASPLVIEYTLVREWQATAAAPSLNRLQITTSTK